MLHADCREMYFILFTIWNYFVAGWVSWLWTLQILWSGAAYSPWASNKVIYVQYIKQIYYILLCLHAIKILWSIPLLRSSVFTLSEFCGVMYRPFDRLFGNWFAQKEKSFDWMNKLMEYVNWCNLLSSRSLCAVANTRLHDVHVCTESHKINTHYMLFHVDHSYCHIS